MLNNFSGQFFRKALGEGQKWIAYKTKVQSCSIKKCYYKFCKFHGKTPVLKSFFNRVAGLYSLLTPLLVFYCGICEIFRNNHFGEHLQMTTSEICSFTWTALFDNFWLKLVPMLQSLYHNLPFHLLNLPSLLLILL